MKLDELRRRYQGAVVSFPIQIGPGEIQTVRVQARASFNQVRYRLRKVIKRAGWPDGTQVERLPSDPYRNVDASDDVALVWKSPNGLVVRPVDHQRPPTSTMRTYTIPAFPGTGD